MFLMARRITGFWLIVKNNIPVLEAEVRKILEDYEKRLELNEL